MFRCTTRARCRRAPLCGRNLPEAAQTSDENLAPGRTNVYGNYSSQYMSYRVFHQLADLGWVAFDLGCSAICPILFGQMGLRQKRLSIWPRWWSIPNLSHSNPSPLADRTPCTVGEVHTENSYSNLCPTPGSNSTEKQKSSEGSTKTSNCRSNSFASRIVSSNTEGSSKRSATAVDAKTARAIATQNILFLCNLFTLFSKGVALFIHCSLYTVGRPLSRDIL